MHRYATRSNTTVQFNEEDNNDEIIQNNTLFIPYARTSNYGLNSVKVKGAKIWNDIPQKIRKLESRNVFTLNLKKHFLEQYL